MLLVRGFPIETIDREHEAIFARPPADVGDLEDGVLEMGGDDFDVVPVERDEFERIHGRSLDVR